MAIFQLLLESGADVRAKDKYEYSIVSRACGFIRRDIIDSHSFNTEILKIIIDNGWYDEQDLQTITDRSLSYFQYNDKSHNHEFLSFLQENRLIHSPTVKEWLDRITDPAAIEILQKAIRENKEEKKKPAPSAPEQSSEGAEAYPLGITAPVSSSSLSVSPKNLDKNR